jgi:hypothetical protein
MSVEDIARAAILGEEPLAARREDFAPSEAKAVAVHRGAEVSAALVARRRRDDAWITDTVVFARDPTGALDWRSEGGGTWDDLPFEASRRTDPLGIFGLSMSSDDEHNWIAAAGFASDEVSAIELRVRGQLAEVVPAPGTGAYVVALVVTSEDDVEDEEVDLLAVGAGEVLDSLEQAHERRLAGQPQALTVAEARALPDGSVATVRGLLLVVAGHPVVVCDEIEPAEPPHALGAQLELPDLDANALELSWEPGKAGVWANQMLITGTVTAGTLRVDRG